MRTILLALFALMISGGVCGQGNEKVEEEIKMVDSISKKSINEEKPLTKTDLEAIIKKALKEQEDDRVSLGEIRLKEKVTIYLPVPNEKRFKISDSIVDNNIAIDSVKIDLQEGMLEYIKVYLANGTIYSNKKAPIAIIYTDNRGYDKLYDNEEQSYILFRDVLTVDTKKRFGFLPNNDTFSLTNIKDKGYNVKNLKKSGSINSLVNFTTYTDLLGLMGDQPNSLVNFEANAKFYINRHNWTNRFIYFLPYVQPSLHYNKVDSKFDTVMVDLRKVNPTEIYRRYNYSVGIDLTLARWDFRPSNSLELKAGYQYSSSKIFANDTLINKALSEIRAVNHIKYWELALHSKLVENFGIELSSKYIWQTLNKSEFYNKSDNSMLAFKGGIYYYPPKGNGSDKIFVRFTNYLVFNKRELDFSQIQVGFSKALNFKNNNN